MTSVDRSIRTPDQRVRVFVSSTLRELAAERRATRAAIEQLNLAPVMFELGARPHPPRDLYRAYLDQSDIFVGIYGQRYGWVAPDEEISGLEDEYRLAPPEMPMLVYVKENGEREPRLVELLERIKSDDRASYAYFTDADQLAELVRGDLSTLLAERFARSAESPAAVDAAGMDGTVNLPAALTAIIGREHELERVVGLLTDDDVRLVTITGPGGIGKSRLSIEAANRARDRFPGGIAFVDLSSVTNPDRVPAAISEALGIRDIGDGTIDEKLRMALHDRRMLLLLDNFEQVVAAAPGIRALLTDSPRLTVLATSRMLLRLTGEHGIELGPLALPDVSAGASLARALATPSVALFVERVRAAKPDFELTDENAEDVERICIALDGVPLAIELAAARSRVLAPAELLDRLDERLLLLSGGARDLPERQRTMRSTIEWSTQLLAPSQRRLLARLGLFAGGFTLDAAEWIAEGIDGNTLDDLGELVDGSLVRQQDRGDRAVFTMLATVRQYALDELAHQPDAAALRDRHAQYFVRLGEQAESELEGERQLEWIARLTEEGDNLRAAARHLLDTRQWSTVAHFAWTLYVYWWVDGHLGEVRAWMREVLESGGELDELTRATALYFTWAIGFWQEVDEGLVSGLGESAELFRREGERSGEALALISLALALLSAPEPDAARADGALHTSLTLFREADDTWGEAMALVTLGRVTLLMNDVRGALARFDESLEVARHQHDELGETIALHHRGWAEILLGETELARDCFEQCLLLSARLRHDEGVAYALEGLTAVAAAAGDIARAGTLLGAAQVVRERTGLYNAPSFSFHRQFVDAVLAGSGADVFEAAQSRGRHLRVDDAVAYALRPNGAGGAASVT